MIVALLVFLIVAVLFPTFARGIVFAALIVVGVLYLASSASSLGLPTDDASWVVICLAGIVVCIAIGWGVERKSRPPGT